MLRTTSPSKVRHRAGIGGGEVGGVADGEDVRVRGRLQGLRVHLDEVPFVAEPGGAPDVGGAPERRHDDGEVEADLSAVDLDDPPVRPVDL